MHVCFSAVCLHTLSFGSSFMMDVSLALLPGSRGKPKLFLGKHILKQHAHTDAFLLSI